jgi:type VI secretion system protein ImpA
MGFFIAFHRERTYGRADLSVNYLRNLDYDMGLSAVLDFTELTGPIAGERATGADMRPDSSPASLWLQIKDARGQARSTEREASKAGNDPWRAADWKPCVQLITQALKEKSKDLDLTAWLLEGMTCDHGFRGLADTFHVAADLIEKYWEGLYPEIADDGAAGRVQQFTGLNGDGRPGPLVDRIYNIPLTDAGMLGPYDRDDYSQAMEMETVTDPERRAARIASGAVTMEQFNTAVKASSAEFLRNMLDDIKEAQAQVTRFAAALRDKTNGEVESPSNYIDEALAECRKVVEAIGGSALEAAAPAESPAASGVSAPAAAARSVAAGAIASREDAFARIRDISRYFRETEPQSPVSYALDQVIRWGKMPLPELLTELIVDEVPRKDLFRIVGLPKPAEKTA